MADDALRAMKPNIRCERCNYPLAIRPPGGPFGEERPPVVYIRTARNDEYWESPHHLWEFPDGKRFLLRNSDLNDLAEHEWLFAIGRKVAEMADRTDELVEEYVHLSLENLKYRQGAGGRPRGHTNMLFPALDDRTYALYVLQSHKDLRNSDRLGEIKRLKLLNLIVDEDTPLAHQLPSEQELAEFARFDHLESPTFDRKLIEEQRRYALRRGLIVCLRQWKRTARIDAGQYGKGYKIVDIQSPDGLRSEEIRYIGSGQTYPKKRIHLPVDAHDVPAGVKGRCPEKHCGHLNELI
jgi:hypothetical protein